MYKPFESLYTLDSWFELVFLFYSRNMDPYNSSDDDACDNIPSRGVDQKEVAGYPGT